MATDTTIRPSSDGSYSQWDALEEGEPAANHYTVVDDVTANSDTDYITAIGAGSYGLDYFQGTFTTITEGHKINSVKIYFNAKKSTLGTYAVRCDVYDGTNTASATSGNLTTSYAAYNVTMTTAPDGSAWTRADLVDGNFEFGVYVADPGLSSRYVRVTQIYVVVNHEVDETTATYRNAHLIKPDKEKLLRFAHKADVALLGTPRLAHSAVFEAYNPDWAADFDTYLKRRPILLGTNHSAYPVDYTTSLEMNTGYEQKIATNGAYNESIQGGSRHIASYNGNIYFTWLAEGDTYLEVYIKKWTYATQTWSDDTYVCSSGTVDDTHYFPTIVIDAAGRIHLFYGCHKTACKWRYSINVEDITSWSAEAYPGGLGSDYSTYPNPVLANDGKIYLFLRGGDHASSTEYWGYYKGTYSTEFGWQWSPFYDVINYTDNSYGTASVYVGGSLYDTSAGRFHVSITLWDSYLEDNKGRAVTYMYSDNFTDWYKAGGTKIGTADTDPIVYTDCDLIWESGSPWHDAGPYYIAQGMAVDGNGTPYITAAAWSEVGAISSKDSPATLHLAKWSGSAWTKTVLTSLESSPTHQYCHRTGGSMYVDGSTLYIYSWMKPTTSEEWWTPELYVYRGSNYATNWSHSFFSLNTAYGIPMMSILPQMVSGIPRILFYCRGTDLFVTEDKYNSQLRTDGADIRILRQNTLSGSTVDTELDRLPDRWQSEDTNIYFKLPAAVDANRNWPHAYDRYWAYYNKYDATAAPHDTGDVFTWFYGFENLDTGTELNDASGWSGATDDGAFEICTYYDTDTYAGANTQIVYAGENALYIHPTDDDDSVIYREISKTMTEHEIEIQFKVQSWGTSNNKLYIELYNTSSEKWIRCGISETYAWYHEDDGALSYSAISSSELSRWKPLRIKINSSGVSAWWDGTIFLTNNTNITSCDKVRIGSFKSGGEFLADNIIIKKYVVTAEVGTVGTEEGSDNMAMERMANLTYLIIEATEKGAHTLTGDKEIKFRSAHKLTGYKGGLERLAGLLKGSKEDRFLSAHTLTGDKEFYKRQANKAEVSKEELIEIAQLTILMAESNERITNIIAGDKELYNRCAQGVPLEAEEYVRLIHNIFLVAVASERIASRLNLVNEETIRIINVFVGDKEISLRFTHYAPVSGSSTERIANAIKADKLLKERSAHFLEADKEYRERIAHSLGNTVNEDVELLSMIAVLQVQDVIRIFHTLGITDKEDAIKIVQAVATEAENRLRSAHNVSTMIEYVERLHNKLYPDKTETFRLAQAFSFEKLTYNRLHHAIVFVGPIYGVYTHGSEMCFYHTELDGMYSYRVTNDVMAMMYVENGYMATYKVEDSEMATYHVENGYMSPNNN